MRSSRRGILRPLLVASCALSVSACGGAGTSPDRLLDGSRATAPKVDLERVDGPTIATKLDLVSPRRVRSCIDSRRAWTGPVVRRVGVNGTSVTFGTASRRNLYACDSSTSRPDRDGWCGRAYGRLQDGRLTDPRLDLTCFTGGGDPVAFAWIEPRAVTRFVAVRQPGFVEVYEVASDVPVRVTTTADVLTEESAAALDVSEHDGRGALLRRYTLEARVAG